MKLAQIKGQGQAVGILSQAMQNKRMAHAYLFEGQDGVGKKTTALSLAQALNCLRQMGDACVECPSCHKIEQGQHPDVRLVEPDGQYIKIEFIRQLQRELASKPYEGRVKVQIIDEAEKLTLSAANCLLKTLEEPPSNSLLILISAHPYNLPATVLSRCQRLTFKQLAVEEIEQLLKDRGLTPAECRLIAFFCQGSLAQAQALDIGQVLAERDKLIEEVISHFPLSGEGLLDRVQLLWRDKEQVERLLKWLLLWFRDLLLIRAGQKRDRLVNEDKWPELSRQAGQFTSADLQQKLYAIERTEEHLRRHVNPQLALEVLFMDLSSGYSLRDSYETAAC
jgi:DNA polymerase-3 subunit delta'